MSDKDTSALSKTNDPGLQKMMDTMGSYSGKSGEAYTQAGNMSMLAQVEQYQKTSFTPSDMPLEMVIASNAELLSQNTNVAIASAQNLNMKDVQNLEATAAGGDSPSPSLFQNSLTPSYYQANNEYQALTQDSSLGIFLPLLMIAFTVAALIFLRRKVRI